MYNPDMICQFQLATLQNVETFRGEYLCKPLYIVYIAFIFPHSQDVINMNNVSNLDSQFPLITCNPQLSLPCIIFFGVIQETFKIISISCGKKNPFMSINLSAHLLILSWKNRHDIVFVLEV